MFPPEVLAINEQLPNPLWDSVEEMRKSIATDFNGGDSVAKSWKWYAQYPTLIGDAMRKDGRSTKYLLYILGTRREFVRRGNRERDFGLIVGFTNDLDDGNLIIAKACVAAAWNLLVVSEHIIEDSERIGTLEAARRMSHTFRTFVESAAIPNVRTLLRAESSHSESSVVAKIQEIGQLAAFMSFVARGGVGASAVRDNDIEHYDPVLVVKAEFESAGLDESKITLPDESRAFPFAHRLYLRAICQELIKNIRDHGKGSTDDVIAASITISLDQDTLTLHIVNEAAQPEKENGQDQVKGLQSLKSMVEACGGTDSSEGYAHNNWKTSIAFQLRCWSNKSGNTRLPTSVTDNAEVDGYNLPAIGPQLQSPSIVVLLLDDQLAEPRTAWSSLKNLGDDNQWKRYIRRIGSHDFTCFGLGNWKLEIVLCRSVFDAKDHLLETHFDICLADVDFKSDRNRSTRKIPSLGGILPALALSRNSHALLQIFTAKDADLRDDANYLYLSELSKAGMLGNLTIGTESGSKEISEQLGDCIRRWMYDILPLLDPDPVGCCQVVEGIYSGDLPDNSELKFLNDRPPVPFGLFGILASDQDTKSSVTNGTRLRDNAR